MSKLSEDLGGDNELITSTTTPPISAENAWRFGIRKEYAKVERDVWTTIRLASVRLLRRILFAVTHCVKRFGNRVREEPSEFSQFVPPASPLQDRCQSSLVTQPNNG